MLPFLKNAQDAAGAAPIETIERSADDVDDYGAVDAIAEDIMHAIEKKDITHLKSALESLIDHIKSEDEMQDAE